MAFSDQTASCRNPVSRKYDGEKTGRFVLGKRQAESGRGRQRAAGKYSESQLRKRCFQARPAGVCQSQTILEWLSVRSGGKEAGSEFRKPGAEAEGSGRSGLSNAARLLSWGFRAVCKRYLLHVQYTQTGPFYTWIFRHL